MRKYLVLFTFSILTLSCGSEVTKNTMVVTGKVKGLKKGTLYLQRLPDSTLVTVDSVEIKGDGNFLFRTELESPEIFYLYLDKKDNNDINDRITFFGEPDTITINTAWNTFDTNAKVTGSKAHEKFEEYQKVMTRFNTKNLELMNKAFNSETALDSTEIDSIQRLSDRNMQKGYAYAVNFALNNKNSYIAPYIALHEISDANSIYLDSIYSVLSPEVAASKYGKALKNHLTRLKE